MTKLDKLKENNAKNQDAFMIKDSMSPIKSSEVTIREEMEEDGKYMLFNAENELILVINTTGKFILENCDGKKNLTQLVKTIEENYTIQEGICLTDVVKDYLNILLKAKLIKIKEEDDK